MSISDVLARISQIEQQASSLSSGVLNAGGTVNGSSSTATSGSGATSSTSSANFANALAEAQGSDSAAATGPTDTATATSALTAPTATSAMADPTAATSAATALDAAALDTSGSATDSTASFPTLSGSELSPTTSAGTLPPSGGVAPAPTTGTTGGVALPANAGTMLTSDQQQFASTLSAETGLNPGVVSSWLLSEESGSAAQSRQAAGNNDWLNIGYTGSGTFGASDAIWSNPVNAANATAQWLQGQDSIPGYGTASSGIQSILSTVGQTPQAQIEALQTSGWSGSGYPSLPEIYASVSGS